MDLSADGAHLTPVMTINNNISERLLEHARLLTKVKTLCGEQ